ncbi:GNAT family N-acetyltransferase [Seonamhaeicola algicola]|uniref:GNAT family N-acetyltransferase n=1 Tax=Seonamhaeicola algicola TaxID=1719036 RepID=A0A5C7AKB6_9FLAO|nr:GNAT family N-acetyltransferase [Seonamhaeicola algicola]TXE06212.1 GNAT family N-acetyltransferase [Seonamhaeicola algicola]
METVLDIEKNTIVENAKAYCDEQGLEVVFTHEIDHTQLQIISERTKNLSAMYHANVGMLLDRLNNGCYLIIKDGEIYGHIFAHKHVVGKFSVFERSSLWVHEQYRSHNLGLLLMDLLTKHFNKNFLISIAQGATVHHNNELLGMRYITLKDLSPVLIEVLEKLGKLRDEVKYKYYVNAYFESKIGQFNKILKSKLL